MSAGDAESEVVIEAAYILLKPVSDDKTGTISTQVYVPGRRKEKTRQFLNRLEESALILSENAEDLTSSAVGQTMERPISAPAITDYLKKNKRQVLLLLEENPRQWPLIRQFFKPLINIVDKAQAVRQIS
ncbi:hypothetical protein JCM15548_1915 [Geofilum rubicundum JCM 15548]|uniref:Uncharacterized protein n=2 Tax=Geofilum TaxID=1236988 RepID=A0A0E9LUG1_9BACT|nr:hypothetical protein JCM15548_1915 [Geofilum rubicundum JCM 15548]